MIFSRRAVRRFEYGSGALKQFKALFPDGKCPACGRASKDHDIVAGNNVVPAADRAKVCANVPGILEFRRVVLRGVGAPQAVVYSTEWLRVGAKP